MAALVKRVYYTGVNFLRLPRTVETTKIQIDAHGGGGGGTEPVNLFSGAVGGFGGHIAAMFGVPSGSVLHIGVAGGGQVGSPGGNYDNGGIISNWLNGNTSSTCSGGKGGEGTTSINSVQGGGGGALSTVLLSFANAKYNENHTAYSYSASWPYVAGENTPQPYKSTPLMWAGGGGGAPGAFPTIGGGVTGKSGSNCDIQHIFGRSYYYDNGRVIPGDMINTPQQGSNLTGQNYGGGGAGGAADSRYGEFSSYEYSMTYHNNGGGRYYYYGQVSAYGGNSGKSGLNGFYTLGIPWHEVPEIFPGGSWRGTLKAAETINIPNRVGGLSKKFENIDINDTKNVVMSLSQYGFGGPESSAGGDGRVTVFYEQDSGQPNEVDTFLTDYDVELDTWYTTRNSITVLGTTRAVPATVIGTDARLVVNGVTNVVGNTVLVSNGSVLRLSVRSPLTYATTKEIYLTIGDPGTEVQTRYVMVTKAASLNFPILDPKDFTNVDNALPNQLISSDIVTITGLATGSASVSVSAKSTSGVPIPVDLYIANIRRETTTGVIENGQTIQVKVTSSSTRGDQITVLVTIGDASPIDWIVTTTATVDTGPEFYNFTNVTDAIGGTEVLSNIVQIQGINYSAPVTTSNPENIPVYVSVNGGVWRNPLTETVTIENNETLQLKITAPNLPNTTVKSTVIVGTNQYGFLPDEWKVTTSLAGDVIPDQFLFVDRNNQKATTIVYSNQIIIRGITSPAPLSITIPSDFTGTQAQFSINNGTDWYNITGQTHPSSPAPQTISNLSSLMLRLRTSTYGSNSSLINVNIGGVTDQWAVTTLPEAPVTDQASTWYSSLGKADGYSIGTVISIFRDFSGTFGTLDGSPESRYPGFIECDGRTLNAADYPDLFDVIGNTYGGSGNKSDDIPYVYSGDFKLPDYRNRKLYGTGRVDGNISSSPSVPTFIGPDGTGTGSSITVGSQGGFWYIDKIDPKGPYPREQLFEDEISSEFFSIGTIRTSGYQNVTGNTLFNIIGNCTADIGPLRESLVKTPEHIHEMVSSAVSETANGLIAWGSPGILPLPSSRTLGQAGVGTFFPGAPSPPAQGIGSSRWNASVTYNNYWASAVSNNIPLNNSNNSDAPGRITTGGSIRLGALDLGRNGTGNVIGFSPGGTLNHNHYISATPFSINTYGYGNVNGPGTVYGASSLSETAPVSFSAAEVALISDLGTFTLSTRKAIVPTAKFSPNVTVPLISKYYRAKYIIKAF